MDLENSLEARAVLLLLLLGLLVIFAAAAGIRRVPEGERLVVLRHGKVLGVRGPGLHYVVPRVDRGVRVPLRPEHLDVWFRGATADGVPVRVKAEATVGVADPVRYATAAGTPEAVGGAVAESALRSVIADRDLAELPRMIGEGDPEPLERLNRALEPWGASAASVTILDVEAPVRPELLRWARGQRTGAGDGRVHRAAGPGHPVT